MKLIYILCLIIELFIESSTLNTLDFVSDGLTAQFSFDKLSMSQFSVHTLKHSHTGNVGKTAVERFKFFSLSLKPISVHARVITMDAISRKSGILKYDQTRSERTPGDRKIRND